MTGAEANTERNSGIDLPPGLVRKAGAAGVTHTVDAPLAAAPRATPDRRPVIARDEEVNLPDCMHSVVGWAEQVVVVLDPRTRDRSREVAASAGADVVEHLFDTHARQRNWALERHPWRTPWILVVDADERVSPELVDELRAIVSSPQAFSVYAVKKRFIFYGKWMRHCWYSAWDLRLFRLGSARYEERPVHEHMIAEGRVGYLKADLIHNDFKDMDSWIHKHNQYATFEASAMSEAGENRVRGRLFGTWTERRRYVKDESVEPPSLRRCSGSSPVRLKLGFSMSIGCVLSDARDLRRLRDRQGLGGASSPRPAFELLPARAHRYLRAPPPPPLVSIAPAD